MKQDHLIISGVQEDIKGIVSYLFEQQKNSKFSFFYYIVLKSNMPLSFFKIIVILFVGL